MSGLHTWVWEHERVTYPGRREGDGYTTLGGGREAGILLPYHPGIYGGVTAIPPFTALGTPAVRPSELLSARQQSTRRGAGRRVPGLNPEDNMRDEAHRALLSSNV